MTVQEAAMKQRRNSRTTVPILPTTGGAPLRFQQLIAVVFDAVSSRRPS